MKKSFIPIRPNIKSIGRKLSKWSINYALTENGFGKSVKELRKIVPDISEQESRGKERFNDYIELKRRTLQAFQCSLMA